MTDGSHRPRVWRAIALGALAVYAVAARDRAAATVVVAKDFEALCREADLIFVGTVVAVESHWAGADRQAIETRVTFAALDWVHGPPEPTVTLRFAGGEIDGLREEVAGVPRFAVGERRVIFAREGRYVSPIVGFDQGVYRVVEDSAGPAVIEAAPSGGASLRIGDATAPAPAAVPLDRFLSRIRAELARAQNTPGTDP